MALLLGLLAAGSARAQYTVVQDPIPATITYDQPVVFGATVTDAGGSPLANAEVTWNIRAAIANVTYSPVGFTDANGHATLSWSFDAASYGTSSSVRAFILSPSFAVSSTVALTLTAGNSAPGAPTNVSAVAGNASATVSFSPPAYLGSPAATSYAITVSPGGSAGSCASSPCAVTGLTNGTSYTFTVQAVNSAGSSAPSAASNAVIPVSSDATLSALSLSAGTLSSVFTPAQTSYTASVPNATTSVSIFASTSNSGASYTVNGQPPGSSVSLAVGPNVIIVHVRAQDGTTQKSYSVVVTRAASSVSTLSALTPSSGTLSPTFSSGVTSYDVSIANSVSSLSLSPTVTDTTAGVRVNGAIVASGGSSSALPMAVGLNNVTVLVTAQDGTTTTTYTVRVTRAPSSVSTLASLAPSSGALSPGFAPSVTSYDVSVANSVSSLSLSPTVTDTTAVVRVNGAIVASGGSSSALPMAVGLNNVTIIVTAQDGTTTTTYTIRVTRAPSSVATLASLAPSSGTLSPTFSSGVTSYDVSIANSVSSLSLSPTVTDTTAVVRVSGAIVASGGSSSALPMAVGLNNVTILVTAEDGTTTTTYTIRVTRAASSVATLASLVPSVGALSPAFAPGTTSYTINVPNTTTSLSLTPTVTDLTASVAIDDVAVASGASSVSKALNVGSNAFSVVVTAQDGVTKTTYTVGVQRAPSSVATLASLAIGSGTLTPGFSPGVTGYAVAVPYATTTMSVTPTLADATASVKVNGTAVASGAASASIPLALGTNDIVVVVTAQDGTTTSTYTLTVTRALAIATVTLAASSTTPLQKVPVTLTASLTGGASPTGTIVFKDGATTIGSAVLAGGSASLTLSSLAPGAHALTAVYSGDGSNQPATSAALTVTVGTRPDPSANPSVRATVGAQVGASQRFGQTQIDNIGRRLERLHDDETDSANPLSGASSAPGQQGAGAPGGTGGAGGTASLGTPGARSGSALAYADEKVSVTPFDDQALARFGRIGAPRPSDVQRATQEAASMLPAALDALNRTGKLPVSLWASASVGFGKQRSDGAPDDRFTATGLTLGLDAPVAPGLKAGLAVAVGTDRVETDTNGTQTRARSVSLAAYGSWRFLPRTFLDLSLGAGQLALSSDRYSTDAATLLGGSRRGTNLFGSVGVTREFVSGPWKWAAASRIDVVSTRLGAYAETGSPIWALTYDAMRTTSVSAVVGGRVAYTIVADWGRLTPGLRLDYRRSLQGAYSQGIQYTDLVGVAPGYTLRGDTVDRDVVTAGLGITAVTRDETSIDLEYLLSASARGIDGQRVTGKVRLRF